MLLQLHNPPNARQDRSGEEKGLGNYTGIEWCADKWEFEESSYKRLI